MNPNLTSFKKKKTDNPLDQSLTASVRLTNNMCTDEKYLELQKQLKKTQRNYKDLQQKYQTSKVYNVQERIRLEMNLTQANDKLRHQNEQKNMLMARVYYLEREINQMKRAPSRSISRSISAMKKSNAPNQANTLLKNSQVKLQFKSDEAYSTKMVKSIIKNQTFEHDQNETSFSNKNFNEVKLDKRIMTQKALIQQENEALSHLFCPDRKCLANYQELQSLRTLLCDLSKSLEQIYIKLNFSYENKFSLQEIAEYKRNLRQISEKNFKYDFFYKTKPDFLINKIHERVNEMQKNAENKAEFPEFVALRSKLNEIKRQQKQLMEQFMYEPYDDEDDQLQSQQILQDQARIFDQLQSNFNGLGIKFDPWREVINKSSENQRNNKRNK